MTNFSYWYCSACGYQVGEHACEDNESEQTHCERYNCRSPEIKQFNTDLFESKYWMQELFDQLSLAEDLIHGDVKNHRISFVLTDNCLESLMLSKLKYSFQTVLSRPNFHTLIDNLVDNHVVFSDEQISYLKLLHQVRNKLYHKTTLSPNITKLLTQAYILEVKEIVSKLNPDFYYPLKYVPLDVSMVNSASLVSIFRDHFNQLTLIFQEEVEEYARLYEMRELNHIHQSVTNMIKLHLDYRDSIHPVSLSNLEWEDIDTLLNSVNRINPWREDTIDARQLKLTEYINAISQLDDYIQILTLSNYLRSEEIEENRDAMRDISD